MAVVVITRNEHIERAIYEALEHIRIDHLIRGKLVAVKPNDTWASPTDRSAVTQADTLRAVLRYVKQFDPGEIVVSGGAGAAETVDVFRLAGLMDVIEEEEVSFFDHNRPPFVSVDLSYAPDQDVRGLQRSVMVNPRILDYETIIALNQLKVHQTATVTLALKNIALSFPAADFYGHPRMAQYHKHEMFEDLHSFIAAMAKRFPIQLAITAGHPAMVGTGPIGGHTAETGLVIASTDPLAADVAGAKILGFELQAVRHLWEASRIGIGESDVEKMTFPAMSLQEAIRAFRSAVFSQNV
ncbi:MAG: DUF362 domain-containing protein [bacterium]